MDQLELECSYPEIFRLSALIACNARNWPGGAALSFSHRFHHWLMLYALGQYIVNVQWSTTSDRFLTIFTFGIRSYYRPPSCYRFQLCVSVCLFITVPCDHFSSCICIRCDGVLPTLHKCLIFFKTSTLSKMLHFPPSSGGRKLCQNTWTVS